MIDLMKKHTLILSALISTTLFFGCASGQSLLANVTGNTSTTVAKPKSRPMVDSSKEAQLNIPYRSLDTNKDLTLIGMGSCADQNQPEPIWKTIKEANPQLFIMMGDNVYASQKENKPIIDQYIKMNQITEYKDLRESIPFLATWDDHDYGQNDGGADNPEKDEARRVFLNYWSYLKFTMPKEQNGVYHSRIIGTKNRKVQIILLDTRWDRSPLTKNPDYNAETNTEQPPKIYLPNEDKNARMLSEDQWKWLDQELAKPANLRLIVSSVQLIANDHYYEKWGNYPKERERFFNLLKKHKAKNAVILSGDRHLAAIAKEDVKGLGLVYDVTSSSLNKPSRTVVAEIDKSYTAPSFLKPNFGLIAIDWTKKTLSAQIMDEDKKVQLEQEIKF
ncbi:phosphodiesterase [Bdellovibrio sp. qaytius]|nr:phosphodiesterase [Bdellovibrio sp. qaytius]